MSPSNVNGTCKILLLITVFHSEGAKLMTEETRGIVVSTLAEAEFYANKGYDDIMYAYPVSPDKIPQIAQLISRLSKFFLTVDNPVILDALESYELTNGKKFSILLMVDTGYGRGMKTLMIKGGGGSHVKRCEIFVGV